MRTTQDIKARRRYQIKRYADKRMAVIRPIYEKTGGRCIYCGSQNALEDITIDHVIPKPRTEENNRTVACLPCNQSKGHKSLEQWRYALKKRDAEMPVVPPKLRKDIKAMLGFDCARREQELLSRVERLFWYESEGLTLSEVTI